MGSFFWASSVILALDLGEVGGGYGVTVGVDVVVESVFNGRGLCRTSRPGRALGELRREGGPNCARKRACLPVIPLEEFYFGVVIDGAAYVPFFAVDGGRKNVLGQARAYAFGNLQRSRAGFVLP